MKVILLENVKKVGQRGELVTVADGYALNVLIPKRLAAPGTAENIKKYEQEQKVKQGKAEASAEQARALIAEIKGKTLIVTAKASETGTLFKSLHESDIVGAIKKEWGIDLPESALTTEHIKKTGTYSIPVALNGAKGVLTLSVVAG
ncbi:MAG: hypothetical protein RLZZ283_738 [Candidatus Parcubacteria bacterium]|jgi:large subunit ribosomal protein L9